MTRSLTSLAAALCTLVASCGAFYIYPPSDEQLDTTVAPLRADGPPPPLLSAFHGLEDGIPTGAGLLLWSGAGGGDGMPVIFSTEIDPATLQAGDLRVISRSGQARPIPALTMSPAIDAGELRTALCLGQFSTTEDPPARVEVVGHVLALDGRSYEGAAIDVTPLADGPSMVLAEVVTDREAWSIGRTEGSGGVGSGCPEATRTVVRVTWNGGIRTAGGVELEKADWKKYRIFVESPDGSPVEIAPDAVADLGDNDNNHLLCFFEAVTPLSVHFPAHGVMDPNDDLNPETQVTVTPAQ